MKKYRIFYVSLLVVLFLGLVTMQFYSKAHAQGGNVLVSRLWDNQNYSGLLQERWETSICSQAASYGNADLTQAGINDRAESGRGYSSCILRVYEHANNGGGNLTCINPCASLSPLNKLVSSYTLRYQ